MIPIWLSFFHSKPYAPKDRHFRNIPYFLRNILIRPFSNKPFIVLRFIV
uniref:Uncharacterized protein n=1 Tax=Enterococcus faecium TaxID=1352 RepID=O85788_ENTFC|nr:unknown [Enterococcus faecium]AAD28231.1 unknown [Enterococcus faecium]